MKIKRTISIAIICVLVVSVFVSVTVSAPPSSGKRKVVTELLHKTEKNTLGINDIEGETYEYWELHNIQGYREVTIYFHSWDAVDASLEITVGFHITGDAGLMNGGGTWDEEKFVFEPYLRARTYEVVGTRIVVSLYNPTAGLTIDDLKIGYYLTT